MKKNFSFEYLFSILEFCLSTVFVIGLVLMLIWETSFFQSSHVKDIRLVENVFYENGKFTKFVHLEFNIDEQNQRVIQKILVPIQTSSIRFSKRHAELLGYKSGGIPESLESGFRSTLTNANETLKTLSDCVVLSTDDWSCDDSIIGVPTVGKKRGIGMRDGEWTGDVINSLRESKDITIANWKIGWEYDRFGCADVCYFGTREEFNKSLDSFMKNKIMYKHLDK